MARAGSSLYGIRGGRTVAGAPLFPGKPNRISCKENILTVLHWQFRKTTMQSTACIRWKNLFLLRRRLPLIPSIWDTLLLRPIYLAIRRHNLLIFIVMNKIKKNNYHNIFFDRLHVNSNILVIFSSFSFCTFFMRRESLIPSLVIIIPWIWTVGSLHMCASRNYIGRSGTRTRYPRTVSQPRYTNEQLSYTTHRHLHIQTCSQDSISYANGSSTTSSPYVRVLSLLPKQSLHVAHVCQVAATKKENKSILGLLVICKLTPCAAWFEESFRPNETLMNMMFLRLILSSSNTVDLVIFACLNFREFLILWFFTKFRISEFSFFFSSAFIIIIFAGFSTSRIGPPREIREI